jgi:ligand-binding sensor domain-containing protein
MLFYMIRFVSIFFLSLLSSFVFCQIHNYSDFKIAGDVEQVRLEFEHLTVSDGLASNEVYCVFQDSYGYLWFGTTNGLSRYDGYQFHNYRNDSEDSTSISNNWITGIDEDIYGHLWVSTQNGLNKFDRKEEIFQHFFSIPGNLNSLSHNYVRSILADNEGNIWIETVNSFLEKYSIKQDSFFHFRHEPYKKIVPLHYHTHHIYEANNGTLWIGSRNIGAYNFDKNTNRFINHFISDGDSEWGKNINSLSNNNVTCFYEDYNNRLWIGSSTSPINVYDENSKIFQRFNELKDIYTICEVRPNKLWMGSSSDGIFIYDLLNNTLQNVVNDPDNNNSLIDNSVSYIFVDRSKNVWIATDKGVSKYNDQKDKFHRFKREKGNKNSISENSITSFVEDQNNNIWIGTQSMGLNKYDRKSGEITRYTKQNSNISSDRISCLYIDSHNDLYVGLMEGIGFDKYNFKSNSFTRFSYQKYSTRKDWYKAFMEDSYGNFWISLWGAKGFVKFNREKETFSERSYFNIYQNMIVQPNTKTLVLGDHIFSIHNGLSLYGYNIKSGKYTKFLDKGKLFSGFNFFDLNGMPNYGIKSFNSVYGNIIDIGVDNIRDIFKSKGKLFVVKNNQIDVFDPDNLNNKKHIDFTFNFVFPSKVKDKLWFISDTFLIQYDINSGKIISRHEFDFLSASIKKASEFREKKLWLIIDNKLFYIDLQNSETKAIDVEATVNDFIQFNRNTLFLGTSTGLLKCNFESDILNEISLLKNHTINSLLAIHDSLYIGTDNGLLLYRINSNELKSFTSNRFLTNQIYYIDYDGIKKIWFGTNKGYGYLNIHNGKVSTFNKPDSLNISSHLQTYLFEDSKKRLWLGTSNMGVSIFYANEERFVHFLPDEKNPKSIHNSYVNFIFEDIKGKIYVGNDVLNIFNPEDESFKKIYPGNSWLPEKPVGMLEDEHNNLWISTENGLCKYNTISHDNTIYYEEDGLQGNQFSKAHYKLQSGEMVFGGINGFSLFHPDSIVESEYHPEIEITQFDIFNTPIQFDFTQKDTIHLTHKDNFFTIHFAAFDYTTPSKNKFKYQLVGIDNTWVISNNENKANYTNVPPGKYIFNVEGTNKDGRWSKFDKHLHIIMKPAFWQTVWFQISIVFAILFSVLYFLIQWIRRIRIMQKNIELEQRLLRSQMNPHFIFNSLTAIQYFIFGNEPAKAGKYLSGFAKLIRLILQNSRSESILLEKEIETLEHYLKLQQLRFEDKFEYQINIDERLNPEMILIPPMLAQPFIENSIEHGIKNISYKGEIKINYTLKNDFLEVIIEDNGIGIESSIKEKDTDSTSHKSLGTSITKERLLNISRASKFKLEFLITDKKEIDSSTSGTCVKYLIPLKYNL